VEQRIETRGQSLSLRMGFPLGQFFKLNVIGDLRDRRYYDNDDAMAELASLSATVGTPLEFVLPADHLETAASLEAVFQRRGYAVSGSYTRAARSEFEEWGLRETSGSFGMVEGGVFVPSGPEPVEDSFTRFDVSAAKEWFLPRFQELRGSLAYLDGSGLDRFSRYQFTFFGADRLDGFSGSGVRFGRGVIGRAGYSFNLLEVLRFDLTLSQARTRLESASPTQAFTGLGLSTNFVGPWKSVIALNYGYAVRSDIPDLEGQQEFLLLLLKLF
jgi:hypothetical protein